MRNHYKTLGIGIDASKDEIKKAYRALALKYHPDKNTDHKSAEQFKEINDAKQVLLDDLKKFYYDNSLLDFLSKKPIAAGLTTFGRQNQYRSNYQYQPDRRTFFNRREIILFLFSIAFLLTIVFFEILFPEAAVNSYNTSTSSESPREAATIITMPLLTKSVEKTATYPNTHKKIKLSIRKPDAKLLKVEPENRVSHLKKKVIPTPKNEEISLSQGDMFDVLNRIKTEKGRTNNSTNCVRICKTNTSNVQNAFLLASFLRSRGYVISGREKIPANGTGISIDASDECIKVTVGNM